VDPRLGRDRDINVGLKLGKVRKTSLRGEVKEMHSQAFAAREKQEETKKECCVRGGRGEEI